MATRMRLLFYSVIPAFGATVICLLWRYRRNQKSLDNKKYNDTQQDNCKPANKTNLDSNHYSDVHINKVQHTDADEQDCGVCNSLRDNQLLGGDTVNKLYQNADSPSKQCDPSIQDKSASSDANVNSSLPDILSLVNHAITASDSTQATSVKSSPLDAATQEENQSVNVSDLLVTSKCELTESSAATENACLDLSSQDPAVIMVSDLLQKVETVNDIKNGKTNSSEPVTNGPVIELSDTNAKTATLKQKEENDSLSARTTAEFDLPRELCGILIGRHGRNVSMIKNESGASIQLRPKVHIPNLQLVTIEGTKQQVHKAMSMIRQKFPRRHYPDLDFTRVIPDVAPEPEISSGLMQLSLPLNVQSDVFISCVVAPNHVFVQQPTHPMFPELQRLSYAMSNCYSTDTNNVPGLQQPYEVGVICAAEVNGYWHRAQLVQLSDDGSEECDVRLVDIGGYFHVNTSSLKQIRYDFLALPFQAIECYLAGVIPPADSAGEDGSGIFPPNGVEVLQTLARNSILAAEVVAVETDGVPYIRLYNNSNNQIVDVNRELVSAGVASWYEM